jgi:hypothetical protein
MFTCIIDRMLTRIINRMFTLINRMFTHIINRMFTHIDRMFTRIIGIMFTHIDRMFTCIIDRMLTCIIDRMFSFVYDLILIDTIRQQFIRNIGRRYLVQTGEGLPSLYFCCIYRDRIDKHCTHFIHPRFWIQGGAKFICGKVFASAFGYDFSWAAVST